MDHKNKDVKVPLFFFILTILTRLPFTSKLLFHGDSVQFALALQKYDITAHQPHPPGYFLYVMLGRLVNLFVEDANTAFVFISILFSALMVVTLFYLGKEFFNEKIGFLAATIALTSPNMWFHGEVALTYIADGLFSTIVALLCWRILKGEHKYIWLSVIALSIAGGMRLYSIIFLFPIWLFSVKGVPLRKFFASFLLFGVVCVLWFVPMVWMTGGWNAYQEAFRELMLFTAVSGIEHHSTLSRIFSTPLFRFLIYGIGAGIFILGLTAYSLIRHKKLYCLDRNKVVFILVWIMPSVLFYLWIGLHPAIPGYALLVLPALFILIAASIEYISNDLMRFIRRDLFKFIGLVIITINICLFFLPISPVSYPEIRNHDQNLAIMIEGIKTFNPANTAIFIAPYMFFSYRHIMYYLPEYRVYLAEMRISPTGDRRKLFWGTNRESFTTEEITVPMNINTFIFPLLSEIPDKVSKIEGVNITNLSDGIFLASGPINLIREIVPELQVKIQDGNNI